MTLSTSLRAAAAVGALLAQFVGELGGAGLAHFGDAIEDLAAVVGGLAGPSALRLARGDDGVAQVFPRPAACVGEQFSPFAGHCVETARLRARKLAVDVELVGLADVEARHAEHHVRAEAVHAAFAAEAAFLVAAEGGGRVELVVGVGPDDAGAQLADAILKILLPLSVHTPALRP